jgi:hypothetical protein
VTLGNTIRNPALCHLYLIIYYYYSIYEFHFSCFQFLQRARTPIVFCTENGLYPEFASAVFYPNGYYPPPDGVEDPNFPEALGSIPRFLNSGCIIGRAGQVSS